MASPYVLPDTVPPPLAAGHRFQSVPRGRARPRDQGERRMRPRFRSTPESINVGWALTQTQFDALDAFFHDTIAQGEREFDLQVHARGTAFDREWFTARWISPYAWEVGTGDEEALSYRVQATLWLLQSLGANRVAPGIQASGRDLDLGYAITLQQPAAARGTDADLGRARIPARPLVLLGLDADLGGWFTGLVVGGQPRVTEAGDPRITEGADARVTE